LGQVLRAEAASDAAALDPQGAALAGGRVEHELIEGAGFSGDVYRTPSARDYAAR
jgi:hypothetical protein